MANALKLSSAQITALRSLLRWTSTTYVPISGQTWLALERRGLVQYTFRGTVRRAKITDAGRYALKRAEFSINASAASAFPMGHGKTAFTDPSEGHELPAPADLAQSLRELLKLVERARPEAICHVGICSMEECARCDIVLRAEKLLEKVPKTWLEPA